MEHNATGATLDAVQFHYDIANPFYELWLDPSMSYSCALFSDDMAEDLHTAQLRKLDYMATQAGIKASSRVLEIGCGWGGMMKRVASHYGAQEVIGLTLSAAQAEWIRRDPPQRTAVRTEGWENHPLTERYDAIVSVEALEHFAKPGMTFTERVDAYRQLFSRCHEWLNPGGRMCLQTSAYGNAGPEDLDAFISSQIFPETDPPRLSELVLAADRLFEIRLVVNDRAHYVRTLRCWLESLRRSRNAACSMVGEDTVQRYEQYLRLCTYMFASGSCELYRVTLQRIDHPRHAQAMQRTAAMSSG